MARKTSRKHLEQLISPGKSPIQACGEESGDLYRTLVENIDLGVTLIDASYRIVMTNAAQGKLFGRPAEDFTGKKCHREFENRLQPCSHCPGRRAMATGEPREAEAEGVKPDGSRFKVKIRAFPLFSEGSPTGFIEVVEDITGRRVLENERQKTQKLESLGILAGGIAHDFNNLLTSIIGNIELANMYLDDPEMARTRLSQAEKASVRAKHLARQLLTFAKGGAPIVKVTCLKDLIQETVEFALRGTTVKPQLEVDDRLWLAELDGEQISQVIQNLVRNAEEAMPEGGVVKIKAENVEISRQAKLPLSPGPYLKVSVQDPGLGIPEGHLGRIFDPYFTTKEKGSGLGLAVCFSIIKRHKGHITVSSEGGHGTTFTFWLPAIPQVPAEKESRPQQRRGCKAELLVLEDNELVQDILREMLNSLGYESTFVTDGTEALRIYQQAMQEGRRYAALILDLTIPGGMGGKETLRRLREMDPQVKAIASSGYATDPAIAEYQQFGFSGVVPKPYQLHELRATLKEVVGPSRTP